MADIYDTGKSLVTPEEMNARGAIVAADVLDESGGDTTIAAMVLLQALLMITDSSPSRENLRAAIVDIFSPEPRS